MLSASADAPLMKATPELKVVKVWVDGSHSADWDMPQHHLPRFLIEAFEKLVKWQELQGLQLAPWQPNQRAGTKGWKAFQGGRFWWQGPFEAHVFGDKLLNGKPAARRQTTGEQRLRETGGKISYRVASYFLTREHLAEVKVRHDDPAG